MTFFSRVSRARATGSANGSDAVRVAGLTRVEMMLKMAALEDTVRRLEVKCFRLEKNRPKTEGSETKKLQALLRLSEGQAQIMQRQAKESAEQEFMLRSQKRKNVELELRLKQESLDSRGSSSSDSSNNSSHSSSGSGSSVEQIGTEEKNCDSNSGWLTESDNPAELELFLKQKDSRIRQLGAEKAALEHKLVETDAMVVLIRQERGNAIKERDVALEHRRDLRYKVDNLTKLNETLQQENASLKKELVWGRHSGNFNVSPPCQREYANTVPHYQHLPRSSPIQHTTKTSVQLYPAISGTNDSGDTLQGQRHNTQTGIECFSESQEVDECCVEHESELGDWSELLNRKPRAAGSPDSPPVPSLYCVSSHGKPTTQIFIPILQNLPVPPPEIFSITVTSPKHCNKVVHG